MKGVKGGKGGWRSEIVASRLSLVIKDRVGSRAAPPYKRLDSRFRGNDRLNHSRGGHKTPKQASGLTDKELKSVFIIRVIRLQEKKPRHSPKAKMAGLNIKGKKNPANKSNPH